MLWFFITIKLIHVSKFSDLSFGPKCSSEANTLQITDESVFSHEYTSTCTYVLSSNQTN